MDQPYLKNILILRIFWTGAHLQRARFAIPDNSFKFQAGKIRDL